MHEGEHENRSMAAQVANPYKAGATRKLLSSIPLVFYLLPYYFLLALLFTYPLVALGHKAVHGPVDSLLNTWILAWDHHALLTQPRQLLHANIFYPYKQTLLYSETLLLPSLLLLPLKLATGNSLLVHNLFVWLGFAATGASGYLLGRWLFRTHAAGLILGSVLAFNSYTLSNIAQAQLLHLEWLPLALLFLGKLLDRPNMRAGLLLAVFLAAQFYTAVYYGIFGFLVVGLAGGTIWLLKSYASPRLRWHTLAVLLGAIVTACLLCLPLAFAYFQLGREFGFVRLWTDTWPFSASLHMWRTAPLQNLLYGGRMGDVLPKVGFYAVDALFPGLMLLSMAVAGLLLWVWRTQRATSSVSDSGTNRTARLYPLLLSLGMGFFFLLSLGPYLQVQSLQPNFDITLPYTWVHQWVPGFEAVRAPVRFAVLVFLGLGIAAAYLLKHLRNPALQALLLILLLVENLPMPVHVLYAPHIDTDRRALYSWLAAQDKTAYLEFPVTDFALAAEPEHWLASQYTSTFHWHATPTGHSGFWPPHYDDMLLLISRFPQPQAVDFLQALGVEWLLLYRDRLSTSRWQAIESAAQDRGWELQPRDGVWILRLPPKDAALPNRAYFLPSRAQMESALTLTAIYTSTAPTPILPNSDSGRLHAEWWQAEQHVLTEDVTHQPPFYVDPVAVAGVSISTPRLAGLYELRLFDALHANLLATGEVTVAADAAPPEIVLLPVIGEQATLGCEQGQTDDEATIVLHLRTIGWYDSPFTLSARVLDQNMTEVARSAADVEFPAQQPRSDLLATQPYTLPLAVAPPLEMELLSVDVIAYQWQQTAERIVPRYFVTRDGAVTQTMRLPLTRPC